MDARAALLIGGGTAVVASVAVASAVAISSAAALTDRTGVPLADSAIVVHGSPAAAPSTSTPQVAERASDTSLTASAGAAQGVQTVPAPAAQLVARQSPEQQNNEKQSAAHESVAAAPQVTATHPGPAKASRSAARVAKKPRPSSPAVAEKPTQSSDSSRAAANRDTVASRRGARDDTLRLIEQWRERIAARQRGVAGRMIG